MGNLIIFIKLLLLGGSMLGWAELLRRNSQIEPCFLPAAVTAWQVVLLFAAGILNLLPAVSWGLFGGGVFLLGWYCVGGHRLRWLRNYRRVEYLYLIVSLCVLTIAVYGKKFELFDNYSHWAIVVKQMLATNRMPNASDSVITFQEYPLGSSLFIYYAARFADTSEWAQMLAQAYMMLACLMPLFFFCRKNRSISLAMMLLLTNFIFSYNIRVVDLLVDTLLPLAGMCGIFAAWHCYGDWKTNKLCNLTILAFLIWIVQIKNSGIFFAAAAALWILFYGKTKGELGKHICSAAAPVVSILVWRWHCSAVFTDAFTSRHSMSIGWFRQVLEEKSLAHLVRIGLNATKFALLWKDLWLAAATLLLAGILYVRLLPEGKKPIKKLVMLCAGLYAVYAVGVICMYLFSMPLYEAIELRSIQRYFKTIAIAVLYAAAGILMAALSECSFSTHRGKAAGCGALLLVLLCQFGTMGKYTTVFPGTQSLKSRKIVEAYMEKYELPPEESYCFLVEKSRDMLVPCAGYLLYTGDVEQVEHADAEQLRNIHARYVIVADPDNSEIQKWISEYYPAQQGSELIIRP